CTARTTLAPSYSFEVASSSCRPVVEIALKPSIFSGLYAVSRVRWNSGYNSVFSNDVLCGVPVFLSICRWLLYAFRQNILQLIERFFVRFLPEGTLLGPHVVSVPPVHQQSWVLPEY